MNKIRCIKSVYILCSIFLLFSLNSCADALQDEQVYRMALQGFCSKKEGQYSLLQSTSTLLPKRNISELNAEAIDDMYDRNKTVVALPSNIGCDKLKILNEAEILAGFKTKPKLPYNPLLIDESWAGFFEKFPGALGVVEISTPGYSKDGRYAVIYLWSGCGSLCSYGNFFQYKKMNGIWVFDKKDFVSQS